MQNLILQEIFGKSVKKKDNMSQMFTVFLNVTLDAQKEEKGYKKAENNANSL